MCTKFYRIVFTLNILRTKIVFMFLYFRLADKLWQDVDPKDFACKPEIRVPQSVVFSQPGANVTLSCFIIGTPMPDAKWVLKVSNNRLLIYWFEGTLIIISKVYLVTIKKNIKYVAALLTPYIIPLSLELYEGANKVEHLNIKKAGLQYLPLNNLLTENLSIFHVYAYVQVCCVPYLYLWSKTSMKNKINFGSICNKHLTAKSSLNPGSEGDTNKESGTWCL